MMPKTIANFSVFLVLTFAWLGGFSNPLNAQGPENVLVVVNADSQDSLAVANHYIQLRDIPAVNVVYVYDVPGSNTGPESTGSGSFRKKIWPPISNAMRERQIDQQIDCIAYSSGFPTRIWINQEQKLYLKQTGQKYNISRHAPWASITSLTYFYQNAFSKKPTFIELDANHFANPRRMRILANPFSGDDATQFNIAIQSIKSSNIDQAIDRLLVLGRVHRRQLSVIYALAQCFSLKGNTKRAIALLEHAKAIGFASKSMLKADTAFANLSNLPAFHHLLDGMEDLPDGTPPTRSFSSQTYWGKNGWPAGNAKQGERYLLSSVLAVTGKDQSTLEASLARLEASAKADGTAPKGNVYFADHKNIRSRVRRSQFPAVVKELKALGHNATIGSKAYPIGDKRVIGATLGSPLLTWPKSKSQFLPGAIVDNFTSFGAWWKQSRQTQASEWLDAGAAGASGTVYEPYVIAAKFPNARWHAHYARGVTLVESYYQSVSGPFQLLLLGDPLCCPFGKFPKFEIEGLEQNSVIDGDFALKIKTADQSVPIKRFEMYFDGVFFQEVPQPKHIAISTDRMSDGYHEIRIVGVTKSPIANRHSEKVGFLVNRKSQRVSLEIKNTNVDIGKSITAKVVSTLNNKSKIKIIQNSRTIRIVRNNETFRIPASKLGLGKTTLQASATLPSGITINSQPVAVSLTRANTSQKTK